MGQSPVGSSYNEEGNGVVFYQGRAEFGTFFPRRRLFTTEPKRMAREGDTLMSVRAPVGDLNVANEDCCIGRGLAAIHSEGSQSFVHYLMRAQAKQLNSFNNNGTVFGSINGKALKELPVFLPSNDAIASLHSLLEPIDMLIRRNDDEIQALEQLRDALLPKLMSVEINVSEVELPKQLNNHFLLQSSKLEFKCIIQYPFPKQTLPNRSMLQPCDLGEKMDETLANQIANKMSIYLNSAQKVEGCSPQTIKYYQSVIQKISDQIQKPFPQITTEDLRNYLDSYQERKSPSRVTLDNIRRIMSTFFSWLEDEEYIVKSPVRRIKRVKTISVIKETFSDEQIEIIRDGCRTLRDRAIIELLSSTGIRIGELVRLNKTDINFLERECIVLGKGNKERRAYFDAKTKIYLERYLKSRNDNNPALFVGFNTSHKRLTIGAIEDRLRSIGKRLGVNKVYPHKFRRTLATNAIDRGMPIEQVQKLLGHSRIDTTLHYALVNESNVKASHRRYLT